VSYGFSILTQHNEKRTNWGTEKRLVGSFGPFSLFFGCFWANALSISTWLSPYIIIKIIESRCQKAVSNGLPSSHTQKNKKRVFEISKDEHN